MNEIHIKSLPLKEVIDDLARVFEVEPHRDCEVYHLDLPNSTGSGTIRGINFSSGLGLIFYDCQFQESIKIHFDAENIHPAKILCCLEGEMVHHFGDCDAGHHLGPYECAIIGSSDKNGHSLSFSAGRRVVLSSVEIDRDLFGKEFYCELKTWRGPLHRFLTDINARSEFYHKSHLSLRHWEVLNGIDEEEWIGVYQRLSLQSKATEIMLWALAEYEDDRLPESKRLMVRKTDIELIRRAAELITFHLSSPLNVVHLAEEVGTNVNKLQNGFKELFNTTVNGYVQRLRLEKTCHYLETTDMNITDIVSEIGLSSHGHHAKMFKQTFGLTPSEYRKKIRDR